MNYNLTCKDCGKQYISSSNSSFCPYCNRNKREYNKICKDCGYTWKSLNFSNEKCPKCGKNNRKNFIMKKYRTCHLICKKCKKEYIGGSAATKCPYCFEENNLSNSVKEFNNLINSGYKDINNGLLIKDIKIGKLKIQKICPICNRKFNINYSSQKYCGYCETYKICKNCNKKYLTYNKENGFCSIRCSNIYRHKYEKFFGNTTNPNNFIKHINKNLKFIPEHTKIIDENNYNFSGIWYKYDPINQIVLDVCLTNNIKEEIKYHFKQIKNKTIEKYLEMSKLNVIEFYYLCDFNTWEEGLQKEMEFALKTNAKYWNPSPGIQAKNTKILIDKIEKENKEREN